MQMSQISNKTHQTNPCSWINPTNPQSSNIPSISDSQKPQVMATIGVNTSSSSGGKRGFCFQPSVDCLRASSYVVPMSGFGFDKRRFNGISVKESSGGGSKVGVVHAAWTRRSRSEAEKKPNKKSWGQRTDMYMRPFLLNVFFSKRYIHAKVVHRGTSKVISVASTNAKDLRNTLPSLIDNEACRVVGRLIAERSKEADVFAIAFETKKDEKVDGKLAIVLDTIKDNGIIFV